MTKLSKSQLANKISEYAHLQDKIKALKDEAEELKEQIKDNLEIGEYGVSNHDEHFIVNFTTSSNQSLDKAKLTEDMGIEFVLKYTKTTAFTKLTIKQVA